MTLQTKRTAFGIVLARATIGHKPVVYTNLRSTYMHELDSALGFEQFNEPALMRSPQDFMKAASNVQYTFNWFYTDDKHIAYFNSGLNPVRAGRHRSAVPDLGEVPVARLPRRRRDDPGEPDRDPDPAEGASAGDRPGVPHELEQQAGAGLQRRRHRPAVLLRVPLAAARQQHQPLPRRRPRQAAARRPDQRDGHRRHAGPARRRGAAVRAEADRHAQEPDARHGRAPS